MMFGIPGVLLEPWLVCWRGLRFHSYYSFLMRLNVEKMKLHPSTSYCWFDLACSFMSSVFLCLIGLLIASLLFLLCQFTLEPAFIQDVFPSLESRICVVIPFY